MKITFEKKKNGKHALGKRIFKVKMFIHVLRVFGIPFLEFIGKIIFEKTIFKGIDIPIVFFCGK